MQDMQRDALIIKSRPCCSHTPTLWHWDGESDGGEIKEAEAIVLRAPWWKQRLVQGSEVAGGAAINVDIHVCHLPLRFCELKVLSCIFSDIFGLFTLRLARLRCNLESVSNARTNSHDGPSEDRAEPNRHEVLVGVFSVHAKMAEAVYRQVQVNCVKTRVCSKICRSLLNNLDSKREAL